MSGDTFGPAIILDCHANARLVFITEEASIAVDLFAFDDLLAQVDELVSIVGDHDVANSVMALDFPNGLAIKQKVFPNHLNVTEPVSPVFNFPMLLRRQDKCCRCVINLVLALNGGRNVSHTFLPLKQPYYHLLD